MTTSTKISASELYKKLTKEDIIESLSNTIDNSIFINNNGMAHYVNKMEVNEQQGVVNITLSDDTKFELRLRMR